MGGSERTTKRQVQTSLQYNIILYFKLWPLPPPLRPKPGWGTCRLIRIGLAMPYKRHAMFTTFFQLKTALTPFAKHKEVELRSSSEQRFKLSSKVYSVGLTPVPKYSFCFIHQ
jgi:hypothetical protein